MKFSIAKWGGRSGAARVSNLAGAVALQITLLIFPGWLTPSLAAAQSKAMFDDHAELEQLAAEQFAQLIEQGEMTGGAVVVVQRGEIFFAQGYGHERVGGRSVDPRRTAFRYGSLSKILTSIAAMQLVEQGQLQLDEPLARHLPVLLEHDPFAEQLTLRHCLTHTDGLDPAWVIGGAAEQPEEQLSLHALLQQRLPPRILPPGEVYVYGDAGFALVGRAIEQVSGQAYPDYVQAHVLEPLGMRNSSFHQRLPAALHENLATGYHKHGSDLYEQPFAFVHPTATAGLTATPVDMAAVMLALLQAGRIGNHRVLQPESAKRLLHTQFAHHPDMPGATFAFYERQEKGHRCLQHGGVLAGYSAVMLLVPEQEVGVLLVANHYGLDKFEPALQALLKRYLPPAEVSNAAQPAQMPTSLPQPRRDFGGRYRYISHSHSTLAKLSVLVGMTPELSVYAREDGSLSFDRDGSSGWQPIAPDVYRHFDAQAVLRRNADGEPIRLELGLWAYRRLPWYEDARLHRVVLPALVLVFLGACGVYGGSGRYRRGDRRLVRRLVRRLRLLLLAAASVNLVFVAGLVFFLWAEGASAWYYRVPHHIVGLLCLPPLAAGLTAIAAGLWLGAAWACPWRWSRLYDLGLLAALGLFGWAAFYWNVMGYRL